VDRAEEGDSPLSVVVVGVEHRQAPLSLLERVAVGDAEVGKVLAALRECANLQESVLLSTCLRTEVYAVVDRFHDAVGEIEAILAGLAGTELAELQPFLGVRFDDDVTMHLFAVAAGLESAVIGESEVLGQVRRAWERAHDERVSGPVLAGLFRHAVETGKRVRSETGIGRGTTSFAHAAVELADRRLASGLGGVRALVIGAGHMGSGVVSAMASKPDGQRPEDVVVANRDRARAEAVAASAPSRLSVRAAGLDEVPELLGACDVAFTAVQGAHPVIGTDQLLTGRSGPVQPLLIVDLGMPRNVEERMGALADVTLVDMEDLRSSVDLVLRERLVETEQARQIVAEEMERYREASRARGAAPVVAALRSRLEDIRAGELARRRGGFDSLSDSDWERIDSVTRAVLAKLVHEPTLLLKETAGTPRGERLVEALRILFDL
jgi:glutamyl-tRNA reductase